MYKLGGAGNLCSFGISAFNGAWFTIPVAEARVRDTVDYC